MDPLDKLKRSVEGQRDDLAEYLMSGNLPDYAAYSKAVGALQALNRVLAEVDEIAKKQLED